MEKEVTLKVVITGDKETYLVKSIKNTVVQIHKGELMFEVISELLQASTNSSKLLLADVSDCTMTAHPTLGWVREVRLYECSTCLNKNLPEFAKFCPDCGGRFDWDKYNS